MDANRPPTLPADAIRRWRDGLRELETLTRAERLQSTYAERFRWIEAKPDGSRSTCPRK